MRYDSSVSTIYENGHKISMMSLAVPKFFEMVLIQLLGTMNTVMLSGYSQEAVAATSVANQIYNLILIALNIIITGMTLVMSVELGKKDRDKAGRIAGTSIIMLLGFSLLLGFATTLMSDRLVGIMNLEGTLKASASGYLIIRSVFLFVTLMMSCFNNLLICNGYANYTMMVGIICNILNVLFGYIVLYSGINLPVSGINGVAIGTVLAQAIALLIAMGLYLKKKCPLKWTLSWDAIKRVLRIGVPSGLGMVSYQATQVFTTGFITSLGMMTLNAKVYISNIVLYTQQFGWAIAQSNGVLMGRYRGSREFDKMKILHRQNMIMAILSNFIFSVIALIFYKPLLSLFTNDAGIFAIAAGVMAVDVPIEIARVANQVFEKSLNANGDVRTTFIAPLITCWLFGVLLAYILGIKCGLGLIGCWIAFAVDEITKSLIYAVRWKSGKWKNAKI